MTMGTTSFDWYVYVLECDDESLYTGITTDPERRIREHNGSKRGARYTRARRPVEPIAVWPCESRSEAATQEAAFKSLDRDEKLRRVRLSQPLGRFRAFEEELHRVFGATGLGPGDCRPLALAGPDAELFEKSRTVYETFETLRAEWLARSSDASKSSVQQLELVLMSGPMLFDGHGLLVGDRPVVFFDMELVRRHFEDGEFEVRTHVAHEIGHGIHYASVPAFYPGSSKGPGQEVWHRLVAEGLAVRLSEQLVGVAPRNALWFGLLDADSYRDWCAEARRRDAALWRSVLAADASLRFDSEVWGELFRGGGASNLGRFGYLYGREIVERAERDHSWLELTRLQPDAWRRYVDEYFATPARTTAEPL